MFRKKESIDVHKFWEDYEASIGEKVLAKSLSQYLSGWPLYEQPLWGLAMATSGGFRFHHFPSEHWLTAMSRIASRNEAPKDKIFVIPKQNIRSVELKGEKSWLRKILVSAHPKLIIHCTIDGKDLKITIETDRSAGDIVAALQN